MSTSYQPGAGEAEFTFVTMGADDVALDMDTEVGYITEDESSGESFVTSVTPLKCPRSSQPVLTEP
jgi:hypothetical protein